jgi:arabinofuranosyltransferase
VGTSGFQGYFSGPHVHLIDDWGLADPLLARLPIRIKPSWRIGHFRRNLPPGYLQSVEEGDNRIHQQNLAEYYDELHLITSGPVWSLQRFAAIWAFNSGQADSLIRDYRP